MSGYQMMLDHRTQKRGGGITIYTKEGIKLRERSDISLFKEGCFEYKFVEVVAHEENNIVIGEA